MLYKCIYRASLLLQFDIQNLMSQLDQQYELYLPKIKYQQLQQAAQKNNETELKQLITLLEKYFKQERWWSINKGEAILDQKTGLLWQGKIKNTQYKYDQQDAAQMNIRQILGLSHWRIPPAPYLESLVKAEPKFPLRSGAHYEINNWWAWLTQDKNVAKLKEKNISYGQFFNQETSRDWRQEVTRNYQVAQVIAVNELLMGLKPIEVIDFFLEKGWSFLPYGIASNDADGKAFITCVIQYQKIKSSNFSDDSLQAWKNLDYLSTRLPKIDEPYFTDAHKGLWEFYVPSGQENNFEKKVVTQNIRARNPALDIQQDALVAIDFGTSSTVVAIRQNGQDELLRIGIQEKDLHKGVTATQFENPTILEFKNLEKILSLWHSEAYRPLLNWDDVHCSHEAKASLNNTINAQSLVLSSIFSRLKQWALREGSLKQVRITDQQGLEYIVPPLTEYNPVKGQAIEINSSYPELDPIELYAWFLGMNINWRGRGIFLDYYMTFPVAYSEEVKAKILASFRRGLMRSLPESLLVDERITQFSVRDWASEPAAYAIAAFEKLDLEPTTQGVAYAVFDFGGGTTDFDFGIYREPTEQEEDLYDAVIEHFGTGGDPFLGGENLIENLAYLVFQQNLDICRQKEISFTQPIDAKKFLAHEQLIDDSQTAYSNTALLMAALRPLWEIGKFNDQFNGSLDIELLNRQSETVSCAFKVKQDELLGFLKYKIEQGLLGFFEKLKQAFIDTLEHQEIHILLAGNASRSNILATALNELISGNQEQEPSVISLSHIFSNKAPNFRIHEPFDANLANHDSITAKTGVALGLLRLCPGERLKVINHTKTSEQAGFQYYVGRIRRGKFDVVIHQGDLSNEWQALGAISEEGIFILLYSQLAQALSEAGLKRGSVGLNEKRLNFSGNTQNQKVFARIVSATQLELCSAQDLAETEFMNNVQVIDLTV